MRPKDHTQDAKTYMKLGSSQPWRRSQFTTGLEHHFSAGPDEIMEKEKIQGTLMLWPGVAEELVGTKVSTFARDILEMWMHAFLSMRETTSDVSHGDAGNSGLVLFVLILKGRCQWKSECLGAGNFVSEVAEGTGTCLVPIGRLVRCDISFFP